MQAWSNIAIMIYIGKGTLIRKGNCMQYCDVRGARLWNNHLQTVTPLLYKKSIHKQISKFFIRNYE